MIALICVAFALSFLCLNHFIMQTASKPFKSDGHYITGTGNYEIITWIITFLALWVGFRYLCQLIIAVLIKLYESLIQNNIFRI
jgi:hypothetical protein